MRLEREAAADPYNLLGHTRHANANNKSKGGYPMDNIINDDVNGKKRAAGEPLVFKKQDVYGVVITYEVYPDGTQKELVEAKT